MFRLSELSNVLQNIPCGRDMIHINDDIVLVTNKSSASTPVLLFPYGKQKKLIIEKQMLLKHIFSNRYSNYNTNITFSNTNSNAYDEPVLIIDNKNNSVYFVSCKYIEKGKDHNSYIYYDYNFNVTKYIIKDKMMFLESNKSFYYTNIDSYAGTPYIKISNKIDNTVCIIFSMCKSYNGNYSQHNTVIIDLNKTKDDIIEKNYVINWNKMLNDGYYLCENVTSYMIFSLKDNDVLPNIIINKIKNKDGQDIPMYIENDKIIYDNTFYFLNETEVPIEDQCAVCFGYTKKTKTAVPCGHRKFCDKCIETMKNDKACYICRKEVKEVITLYD
jgi:hypothetical protein